MKNIIPYFILFLLFFVFGCEKENLPLSESEFTDPRDGQVYPIVKIGDQYWFASNLNYADENSWCYDNDVANCNSLGRLYDWNTALEVCPNGWHLPSDKEWDQLIAFLGGESIAGGKLKCISGWSPPNKAATNISGFSGLPGGKRFEDGSFDFIGLYSDWWSSDESNETDAWSRNVYFNYEGVNRFGYYKTTGLACRCIKD